jgi:hypothetical protein
MGHASLNQSERVVSFPGVAPRRSADDVEAVLNLLSEAAEEIKLAEGRAAETMARAQTLANGAAEKLRLAQARIERAQTAQRKAESELADFRANVEQVTNELKQAQEQIAVNANELAAAEQRASTAEWRASAAEKRANDVEATLERIVHAIRTQFPSKKDVAAIISAPQPQSSAIPDRDALYHVPQDTVRTTERGHESPSTDPAQVANHRQTTQAPSGKRNFLGGLDELKADIRKWQSTADASRAN